MWHNAQRLYSLNLQKMENVSKEVAGALLGIGAVKVSMDPPFQWVSGIKSPVYCDNRMMISHVAERQIVVDAFKKMVADLDYDPDYIGGTATAAIPWAGFLAQELGKPMIYIRPKKKEHGAGKQIEGDLEAGKKVLIIEDLISTGGSSVRAAQAVREEGQCEVSDIFAIVTWEMGKSKTAFEEAGINLTTLTGFTDLIGLAEERSDITSEQAGMIHKFKEDPAGWWDVVSS